MQFSGGPRQKIQTDSRSASRLRLTTAPNAVTASSRDLEDRLKRAMSGSVRGDEATAAQRPLTELCSKVITRGADKEYKPAA